MASSDVVASLEFGESGGELAEELGFVAVEGAADFFGEDGGPDFAKGFFALGRVGCGRVGRVGHGGEIGAEAAEQVDTRLEEDQAQGVDVFAPVADGTAAFADPALAAEAKVGDVGLWCAAGDVGTDDVVLEAKDVDRAASVGEGAAFFPGVRIEGLDVVGEECDGASQVLGGCGHGVRPDR